MKYVLMSMSLLTVDQLCAQRLERYVLGSAGLSTQHAGLQLSFTLGEAVVGSYRAEGLQLYQGFQQGGPQMITGIEEHGNVSRIRAYPNPVGTFLFLDVSTTSSYEISWEIHDLTGRTVFVAARFGSTGHSRQQIDVSELAQGIYFLVIRTKNGYPLKTFKIQKILTRF